MQECILTSVINIVNNFWEPRRGLFCLSRNKNFDSIPCKFSNFQYPIGTVLYNKIKDWGRFEPSQTFLRTVMASCRIFLAQMFSPWAEKKPFQ